MKFFSRSTRTSLYSSPAGSVTSPEFGLELDSEGNEHLTIVGEIPMHDIIQAAAEGANINHIITRWRAGDESVLNASQGVFGDFTSLPSDLASSQRAIIKAQNIFNALPVSEREKFGMNLSNFLNFMNSPISNTSSSSSSSVTPSNPPSSIEVDGVTYHIQNEVNNS